MLSMTVGQNHAKIPKPYVVPKTGMDLLQVNH